MAKKERKGKNKEVQVQEEVVNLETYVPNEEKGEEIMESQVDVTVKDSAGEVVVDYDNSLPVAEAIKANNQDQPSENKKDKKKEEVKKEKEATKQMMSADELIDAAEKVTSLKISDVTKEKIRSNWDMLHELFVYNKNTPGTFEHCFNCPQEDVVSKQIETTLTCGLTMDQKSEGFEEFARRAFTETILGTIAYIEKSDKITKEEVEKISDATLKTVIKEVSKNSLLSIGIIDSKLGNDTPEIDATGIYFVLGFLSIIIDKNDLPKLKDNFVKAAMDPKIGSIKIEHLILLTV